MPRALLAALLLGSATGQRTPAQRVYDELEAQVAFFPQITTSAEAAQVVAETLSHPYGLALLNGRVFARDHAGITRPYLRHLRLLLDAAASHRAANVVLAHDSVADGCITACVGCTPGSDERYLGIRALPSTRVTKSDDACGVVVPEGGHAVGRERPAAVQRSTVPYGRRRAKAFWRGRLVEPGDDPALCVGNRARAEGLSLTLREPDLFDVKALSISPAWGRNGSCLPAAYEALRRTRSLRRVTEAKRQNHFARYNYYARYKMLLHFPDRGGVGRPGLWATDSVILRWSHGADARRYPGPGLANGTTHLDVDLASAAAAARAVLSCVKINQCVRPAWRYYLLLWPPRTFVSAQVLRDESLAARLRAGAKSVAEDLACPDCVKRFLADALRKLRDRHLQHAVLDDRHALRAALEGASCEGLVEYVPRDVPVNLTARPGQEYVRRMRNLRGRFRKEHDRAQAAAGHSAPIPVERLVAPVPLPNATAGAVGFDDACVALVEAVFS